MSTQSTVKRISRCMFCNSTSYGAGCPYSPHKKHVHVSDPHKCIYCGSPQIGAGCPYNPFGNVHIRGVEYNNMTRESVHQSVMMGLFLSRLTQPLQEMPAFKMGLINEKGHRIKDLETDEERAALSPLDMYIIKIRKLVGEHVIELFKSNVLLEMTAKQNKFDASQYQHEVELSSRIDHIVESLNSIFVDGIESGFSKGHVENLVIESIIKKYNDKED